MANSALFCALAQLNDWPLATIVESSRGIDTKNPRVKNRFNVERIGLIFHQRVSNRPTKQTHNKFVSMTFVASQLGGKTTKMWSNLADLQKINHLMWRGLPLAPSRAGKERLKGAEFL